MKKKLTPVLVVLLCIICFVIGASSESVIKQIEAELRPDFSVFVDGVEKTFKNANGDVVVPVLYEGTTYLPLRAIGELMGKTVYWYEDLKKVELKDDKTTVTDADVIVPSGGSSGGGNSGAVSVPTQDSTKPAPAVSLDAAKKIALEKAGLAESEVTFTETEFDEDDGRFLYELEFRKGVTKYSADVSAKDGTILEWDVDLFDD